MDPATIARLRALRAAKMGGHVADDTRTDLKRGEGKVQHPDISTTIRTTLPSPVSNNVATALDRARAAADAAAAALLPPGPPPTHGSTPPIAPPLVSASATMANAGERKPREEMRPLGPSGGHRATRYNAGDGEPPRQTLGIRFVEAEGGHLNPEEFMSTSSEAPLDPSNRGYKLLLKMGWKQGQGIGKEGTGMKQPLSIPSNDSQLGLGKASQYNAVCAF